jgi:ubiquinone/menaquinone biosynthesis C-methylase UbiE
MAPLDTKHAEKEYLARTGSSTWERVKPFSYAGADTLAESAQLLHDFAVAMLTLQPSTDDLILDLGAGGCWCSDLLGRLNRRSVAVDISVDMLRTGRSRPTGVDIRAVAGDLESLPFRSGTFQKAVCLNAIHHVPDIPAALREVARVLTDEGVALFSEPGRGHAQAAVSTAAMRDFGVLEQDILVTEFTRACSDAGFRDIRLKVLSYASPAFDLTMEQWQTWSRLATSKRPVRALEKMGRACAEFLGIGKQGPLFEEALAMSVVRTLCSFMKDHPIVMASKAPAGTPMTPATRRAEIVVEMGSCVAHGGLLPMRATLTNRGSSTWQAASSSGTGHVSLGLQLLDDKARLVARDHHRVPLPRNVAPGGSVSLTFDYPAPDLPGACILKFDLVAEGVTWFEAAGSTTISRRLAVI